MAELVVEVVNKTRDENIVCGVGRMHLALANLTWPELMEIWLWTKDSMRILVVVCVGGNLR